ncbi:hypothetical protein C8Q78DRAFT_1058203 [Trametes maxima]|nr:hypothetical protein C8Q78DRAFT_1058203 [Trametes maxima]
MSSAKNPGGLAYDQDSVTRQLRDTHEAIEDVHSHIETAQNSRSAKFVDGAGKIFDAAQAGVSTIDSAIAIAQPLYESDAMKTIRDGITTFVEGLPGVLKALDEVANIHPFIKFAVGAFRVVVELDVKRRDNEKKITVLFVEMKDMMEVLIQLREVKDEDAPGLDGTTIKARMEGLIALTADDIKACANACDTYSKKRLLVKVLKSSSWDDKFQSFLTLFADRRKAFMFALDMHVGRAVDGANRKLDAVDKKLSAVLEYFSSLVPLDQVQLREMVRNRGGVEAVARDDNTLALLMKFAPSSRITGSSSTNSGLQADVGDYADRKALLGSLREELADSADVAMQRNLETFEGKFVMQQRRLMEEMKGVMHHESDRVIDSVMAGPHDRIKDRDIHELWKEMRWRGHVKARHFVLALRDFYLQQADDPYIPRATVGAYPDDKWAIEYLDVSYISALIEAFDDDASGFITINEVNRFTSSRPQGWSLLHWIAYWAKGWHMASLKYTHKIQAMFAEMFAMLPYIRAENHKEAYHYLERVWSKVTNASYGLIQAHSEEDDDDKLWARFESYVEAEEKRLDEGLQTVRYYIDALDTVSLITGPGRIEKFILPLLYLKVRRDLDVFRLAHRRVVLDHYELRDSTSSLALILWHMVLRMLGLAELFKQRGLDPAEQFKTFASGMHYLAYSPGKLWDFKNSLAVKFPRVEYSEDEIEKAVPALDVLHRPISTTNPYNTTSQDTLTKADLQARSSVKAILGHWYGFYGDSGQWPAYPMASFFLHASTPDTFESQSISAGGVAYTITGRCEMADGRVEYVLYLVYVHTHKPRFIRGHLSEDGYSISGVWGFSEDALENDVYYTRLSPETLSARPSPQEFRTNRLSALWRFALTATRRQVRLRTPRLAWRYLKEFNDKKNLMVRFLLQEGSVREMARMAEKNMPTFWTVYHELTYDEVRFVVAVVKLQQTRVPPLQNYLCNVCDDSIANVRYTCVPCSFQGDDSFDLCDKPQCRSVPFKDGPCSHLPSHPLIVSRRMLFPSRDVPWLLRRAREIVALVEATFKDPPESPSDDNAEGDSLSRAGSSGLGSDSRTDATRYACVSCAKPVHLPFFICIDCEVHQEVYICTDCDSRAGGVSRPNGHRPSHSLVRCTVPTTQPPPEGPTPVEGRLLQLESQVALYASRFDTLDERLDRMERLMETMSLALTEIRGRQ